MLDANTIVQTGSLLLIAAIIFAETGLLIGIIFPGDSLLVAAGYFASQGLLPVGGLIAITFFAAVTGYHAGYIIGRQAGPRIFKRQDGILFRREYIARTQRFFIDHGGKTVLFARFIPIIRTFVSFVAGMGRMDTRRFAIYNLIGAALWVVTLCLGGYWLGKTFDNIEHYITWAMIIFAPASLVVGLIHVFSHADARRRLRQALAEEWRHFFGRAK